MPDKQILETAIIDADTPVGRVYMFPINGEADAVYHYEGLNQHRALKFTDQQGTIRCYSVKQWNEDVAPTVTEVYFPEPKTVSSDAPEPAEPASDIPNDTPAKHLARIQKASQDVRHRGEVVSLHKVTLKEAKDCLAVAQADLLAVIGGDPNQMHLFDGEADPETGEIKDVD